MDPDRGALARALSAHRASRVPDADADFRAAVTLVVRSGPGGAQALFVQRAEVDADPWSGHMALPGGRADPDDRDLLDTARRELAEETALRIGRAAYLGRLDDIHPQSPGLPSIAVSPFVAWCESCGAVVPNHELRDHVWIPLPTLSDPAYRSSFVLRLPDLEREFATIEFEGYTIWGLTFEIVRGFLKLVGR